MLSSPLLSLYMLMLMLMQDSDSDTDDNKSPRKTRIDKKTIQQILRTQSGTNISSNGPETGPAETRTPGNEKEKATADAAPGDLNNNDIIGGEPDQDEDFIFL